ncbi:MAG: DUF1285 domain-containing protein [Pseudomonadota bacterium]
MAAAEANTLPPVDSWDPPYCGDIGMEIRADGTWYYQNSPIGRQRLVKLFSRILRRDPDGRHFLVTPAEKVDVAVADAPFIAVEMDVDGTGEQQTLTFRTNVDDVVKCGPETPLTFAKDPTSAALKPYVRVRGRLDALVARAVYYDLVELAVPRGAKSNGSDASDANVAMTDGPGEDLGLWSGGTWFPISE